MIVVWFIPAEAANRMGYCPPPPPPMRRRFRGRAQGVSVKPTQPSAGPTPLPPNIVRSAMPPALPSPDWETEEVLVDLRNQAIIDLNNRNEALQREFAYENQSLRDQLDTLGRQGWQEWNDQGYIVCNLDSWKKTNSRLSALTIENIILKFIDVGFLILFFTHILHF